MKQRTIKKHANELFRATCIYETRRQVEAERRELESLERGEVEWSY